MERSRRASGTRKAGFVGVAQAVVVVVGVAGIAEGVGVEPGVSSWLREGFGR